MQSMAWRAKNDIIIKRTILMFLISKMRHNIEDPLRHVEIRETKERGLSLFAKVDFRKGDIVLIAFGRIIPYATDYTIPIDYNLYIEPRGSGSPAQYINHSCEPNIGVKDRSIFVAMRDIYKGEEVIPSYAFLGYEYGKEMTIDGRKGIVVDRTCRCGTPSCTGRLQCYKEMPPEWRSKYKEYISDYLLDYKKYPFVP